MKIKHRFLFAGVAFSLMASGAVIAQKLSAPEQQLLDAYTSAETDGREYSKLMDVYAKMPGNAPATKQAARLALVDGKSGNVGSGMVALILQNQKLIEQNERIIKLLEKQAAKK